MTVKQLKKKLAKVPGDTSVVIFDSNAQVYIEAESAKYMREIDYWTSDSLVSYRAVWILWGFKIAVEYFLNDDINSLNL